MTEPMRDTLARLAAMRKWASPGEWVNRSTPARDTQEISAKESHIPVAYTGPAAPDADLIVAEHNSGPARDEMLERAREIIRWAQEGSVKQWSAMSAWLADYEGAQDA